ncbi:MULTISPECIES: class I SAM-dependent methyltransferase [unclassified Leeuwenhoekiella]|uniref:class I SAM-dependent methyltransferase n=1 Tax=unclassified Leeuwenhoekiella TaxID=2615029 RepID=UPI000C43C2FC|nr:MULTISPECIES: class I SAM-dependent methyltransferase [unclassified Leeuwenhoekiella]MAW95581.1 SAM-dependent methyltransferase [Leeuwenhoekiella sp.]MBA82327.1 SAM-dependent methyltransferase [Leeuwenhoekiella sp.]
MNPLLLKPELQKYLRENLNLDTATLALKGSPFDEVSASELAQQLTGLQKSQKKLPSWFKTRGVYYPPKLNLEQTSSEETAAYKAALYKGDFLADLTGGYGVDSLAFSKSFEKVFYCERNHALAQVAQHNFKQLGASEIEVAATDSMDFLNETSAHFDLLYADPSRRHESKGKVFMLADCEPNIPQHLDLLFKKSKRVMVKTSPLLDIQAAVNELKYVAAVHVVALKNEVKELLFILEPNANFKNATKFATNLNSDYTKTVRIDAQEEQDAVALFDEPLTYLYEPNAALMKLGVFNWIAAKYNLYKLAANSHLYTSTVQIDFPGRRFKIKRVLPYSKKLLTKEFKNQKAHITTRNFKESVAQIRSKFRIKDGGDLYLFFTTLENGETIIIECLKT